jgi:transposase
MRRRSRRRCWPSALAERDAEAERLRQIIKALQRHRFGRSAETLPVDQLELALEDVEQVEAADDAKAEAAAPEKGAARARTRRANRGSLPAHLPRIETIVDITDKTCPCCQGVMHQIGEDVSERLDVVPAQFRVLVTRRPKYACRACEEGVVQAPAPARLIEGGMPTEALVAHVLVAKYADHCPLYRQAQIYARQGVLLDRSTLADRVGRAAFLLRPVRERLLENLKTSSKLFADETRLPVLDPGRGRTTRPASSGPTPVTTGPGAAPIRPPSPLRHRPNGPTADQASGRVQERAAGGRLCRLSPEAV